MRIICDCKHGADYEGSDNNNNILRPTKIIINEFGPSKRSNSEPEVARNANEFRRAPQRLDDQHGGRARWLAAMGAPCAANLSEVGARPTTGRPY